MCKPKIWFSKGIWFCRNEKASFRQLFMTGMGENPKKAYEDWRRRLYLTF